MAGRCEHWVGIFDAGNRGVPMARRACAAGVRYMTLARATRPTEPGWNSRLPCWGRTAEQGAHPCPTYAAQADAAVEAARARIRKMLDIIPDLVTQMQASIDSGMMGVTHGRAECPMGCGGKISWTYERFSSGRDSSQAACSTPDCVRWMT